MFPALVSIALQLNKKCRLKRANTQGKYELHEACMAGDFEKVKALLEMYPDKVDARGPKNVSFGTGTCGIGRRNAHDVSSFSCTLTDSLLVDGFFVERKCLDGVS